MSRAVFLLTATNFLVMAAGFIRELAIAYRFGTTAASDTFAVALLLIDGVTLLAASGLGSYMMVPVATRLRSEQGPDADFGLMDTLCLWSLLCSFPVVLAVVFWPGALAGLLGWDFSRNELQTLAWLLRLSIPAVPLLLTGGILAGILQARALYCTPVMGRGIFSLSVAVLVLAGPRRWGIYVGGAGILAGALLQVLLLIAALWKSGWRPRLPRWFHPALPNAFRFALPTLLALTLTNVLMGNVQRSMASGLPEGSIAAISYAQRLLNIVANLSIALGTVSLTELALEHNSSRNSGRAAALLRGNIEGGVFILAPLSLLLFVYSDAVASLLFQRGHFDAASTALTAVCVRWFSVSIVPAMVLAILLRAYPAFWRPWATVWISLIWLVSTVAATAILLPALGPRAVPGAYSFGILIAMAASCAGLVGTLGKSFLSSLWRYTVKVAIACGVASVVFGFWPGLLLPPKGAAAATNIRFVLTGPVIFLALFLLVCRMYRDQHVEALWNLSVVHRARRKLCVWQNAREAES